MGVIAWIFGGLIAGWLATKIMGGPGGLLHNLALGLFGAVIGGLLFRQLGLAMGPGPAPAFIGNVVIATVGAAVVLLIWRAIRRA